MHFFKYEVWSLCRIFLLIHVCPNIHRLHNTGTVYVWIIWTPYFWRKFKKKIKKEKSYFISIYLKIVNSTQYIMILIDSCKRKIFKVINLMHFLFRLNLNAPIGYNNYVRHLLIYLYSSSLSSLAMNKCTQWQPVSSNLGLQCL